jgi:hypothetical protein
MQNVDFPESNTNMHAPAGMTEEQVGTCRAYVGKLEEGNNAGMIQSITAWKPTEEDLDRLIGGGVVYFQCLGRLPPHFLTTDFKEAINTA